MNESQATERKRSSQSRKVRNLLKFESGAPKPEGDVVVTGARARSRKRRRQVLSDDVRPFLILARLGAPTQLLGAVKAPRFAYGQKTFEDMRQVQ